MYPVCPTWSASEQGIDWDSLDVGDPRRESVTRTAREIVDQLVAGRFAVKSGSSWTALARFAQQFLDGLRDERELDMLVNALSGRYIAPAPGGDPAPDPGCAADGTKLAHAGSTPYSVADGPPPRRARCPQLLAQLVERRGNYPETIHASFGAPTISRHKAKASPKCLS